MDCDDWRIGRRAVACRAAIFGTPLVAAGGFLSTVPLSNHLRDLGIGPSLDIGTVLITTFAAGGALASVVGPAAGAALLSNGRARRGTAAAVCYAVAGLLAYLVIWFGAIFLFE